MDFPEGVKRTKGPHFVAKRLTLSGGNFSLLAPKLMRFFQRQEFEKSSFLFAQFFTSRFLCSQNAVETFYYSVILSAFSGHLNSDIG